MIDNRKDANFAIDGDIVEIDIKNRLVTRIVKRSLNRIPGVLKLSSRVILGFTKNKVPLKKFILINKKYPIMAISTKKPFQSEDVYCVVKFNDWTKENKYATGTLESIIGKVGDYNSEQEFIKYRYKIKWKRYRQDLKIEKYLNDLTPKREDYTKHTIISIDPYGCKYIDDAFHICEKNEKYYEVGIHIADVSSFIPIGSEIDEEIKKRGKSVYLLNKQINMLPDIFANDICSLVEGKERRTFSVLFIIKKSNGEIENVSFNKGKIVNKHNMSYEEAEKMLQSNDNSNVVIVLQKLYSIGKIIYKNKNLTKNLINYNEKFDVHKLVELFMIMTNSHVGKF